MGESGNMVMGVNMAQAINSTGVPKEQSSAMSLDQQIDALKKLKELVDVGILSEEEFNVKKKEIMGL